MKRFAVIIAVVVIIILILGKCTSTDRSANAFSIARDPKFEPLPLYDKSASVVAFSDELMAAIAAEEKVSLNIISVLSSHLFRGLDNHEYEGVLTSLTPSPQTFNAYIISEPYLLAGPVVIVQASSSIDSILELDTKTIGILRNSPIVFDIEQYPKVSITSFGTPTAAIDSLIKNQIDAVVMDALQAHAFVKIYAGQIKIATPPISQKGLRLVTLQNATGKALINIFNNGLKAAKADGTYKDLLLKWDLFNPEHVQTE